MPEHLIVGAVLIAVIVALAWAWLGARAAQRRVEAELKHLTQARAAEAQSRDADPAAFFHSVAHDLRGPLRTIGGFSDALLESHAADLKPEAQRFLGRIQAATLRMDTMLRALLTLAQVSQAPLRRSRLDLGEAARTAAGALAAQDPSRNVAVMIDPGMTVYGDPTLLGTAIHHLLENAWKFTARSPSAEIRVGSRVESGEPVYYVRDNGVGFDPAHARKLFGMFERLPTAADFPGEGVGLAIARRIIERHGGSIRAACDGGLTEFAFRLPAPAGT